MNNIAVCSCGKRFAVKAEWAGRQMRCPVCGQVFVVPHAQQPTPQQMPTDPAAAWQNSPLGSAPGMAAPGNYGPSPRKSSSGKTAIIVGACCGGVVLLAVVIVVVIMSSGSENPELPPNSAVVTSDGSKPRGNNVLPLPPQAGSYPVALSNPRYCKSSKQGTVLLIDYKIADKSYKPKKSLHMSYRGKDVTRLISVNRTFMPEEIESQGTFRLYGPLTIIGSAALPIKITLTEGRKRVGNTLTVLTPASGSSLPTDPGLAEVKKLSTQMAIELSNPRIVDGKKVRVDYRFTKSQPVPGFRYCLILKDVLPNGRNVRPSTVFLYHRDLAAQGTLETGRSWFLENMKKSSSSGAEAHCEIRMELRLITQEEYGETISNRLIPDPHRKDIAPILAKFKSDDIADHRWAAEQLQSASVEESYRAEVVKRLEELVARQGNAGADTSTRAAAIRAMGQWGGAAKRDYLIGFLKDKNLTAASISALGKIGDEESLRAVATRLKDVNRGYLAEKVLIEAGPKSVPLVRPYLNSKLFPADLAACRILAKIGNLDCIPEIEPLLRSNLCRGEAQKAINAIRARGN